MWTLLLIAVLIGMTVCGLLGWRLYRELEAWLNYDPKEAAMRWTEKYLQAAYAHPNATEEDVLPSCGGMWSHGDCWAILQEAVAHSSNQYTMTVVYYNWEDDIPWRGGDEIIVQVNFANSRPVMVFTYEGCIDYCIYQPDNWTPPNIHKEDNP